LVEIEVSLGSYGEWNNFLWLGRQNKKVDFLNVTGEKGYKNKNDVKKQFHFLSQIAPSSPKSIEVLPGKLIGKP
jgi:hypothetical protein